MFFGSKYVYRYARSESESVSEDEDSHEDLRSAVSTVNKSREKADASLRPDATKKKKHKHLRRPDTNILSIKFDRLLKPGEMHAGDPVKCNECDALASNLSKIVTDESQAENKEHGAEQKYLWKCDFCANINTVDIEQSDLPKKDDATYLIAPAPLVHASDFTGIDDSMVIFLIDTSGSMSCTTLVQGGLQLPDHLRNDQRNANRFDGEQMIRQRDQTYVSRLQGVQMAVATNLDKLTRETPTKRALLLSFNHEITYYGDGTRVEPLVIRGDKLNNEADLLREAEHELNNESKPVSETKEKLTECLYDLEESGQTALGPAVVFALTVASRRPGSQLVICTDGLANRGLGNLETAQDEKIDPAIKLKALEDGNRFYANLTERAREKGVSISVITVKGTTCLLPVIGQMADGTGGNVTIVDLTNIRDQFASILEQKVLATKAVATLVLHRALYIRNPDNLVEKLHKTVRDIGNVTKQTEITFEFGVRDKNELKEKYKISIDEHQQLPFQIQVAYTDADGSQALRVLTELREATTSRDVAEVHAVRSVIAENHIRRTADDMMVGHSDDEDEESMFSQRRRMKFSTQTAQIQGMQYMEKLNRQVRLRETDETDKFNERRWDAASKDLKSRAKKVPAGSSIGRKQADLNADVLDKKSSRRAFGFSTAAASRFNDTESEDLYRFKHISSDYMRETSPIREEDPNPGTASASKKNESASASSKTSSPSKEKKSKHKK